MHVTGHGFTEWAVLSVSMGWGSVDGGAEDLLPYDADFRTGITFWARIGDTSTDKVRLAISDKYSRPEGGFCVEDSHRHERRLLRHARRRPDPAATPPGSSTASRSAVSPSGTSACRGRGSTRASIYTVEFQFATVTPFDFWVDDVAFY